jgi:hypothetical protein
MRERKRLGIAMAATIRIIETTTNNSIKEKPVCFERIAVNSSNVKNYADKASFPRPRGRIGQPRPTPVFAI